MKNQRFYVNPVYPQPERQEFSRTFIIESGKFIISKLADAIRRFRKVNQQTNELRGIEKKSGESFSTFSASVPRPVFEITKSGTIRLNSKTIKFKLN